MDRLREIYKRFKKNYRNDNGGINLYPEFDKDLEAILKWVGQEFIGLEDITFDCVRKPPLREDD